MTDTTRTDTARLGLPLLAAAQAQKHVTHNEALLALDALVQLACLDRDLAAPPASPPEGARYIVAGTGSGAWAGQAGAVAEWRDGTWHFTPPRAGFLAFLVDEAILVVFDGGAWSDLGGRLGTAQGLARLGLGTAADAANPFSAKLNAALWTARTAPEGGSGDLRVVFNKASAGNIGSLLLQSGYSGRAEFGLVGSDELSLKVSGDGAAWAEALRVKPSGNVGVGTASAPERLTVGGTVAPAIDNAYSLGTASLRVSTVWAATGAIATSDLRLKTDVAPLPPATALRLLAATAPIAFRWRVGGREPGEGDGPARERPGRRLHFGWSAQSWDAALRGEGLEAGLLVKVDPAEPATELGLRPDQIVAVQHAALCGLAERVDALAIRVAALERVSGPSSPEATDPPAP